MAALRAACANDLQRSVNLLVRSALATIGLTVPAVLAVGLVTGREMTLCLDDSAGDAGADPGVEPLTFGGVRANLLQGAVHLVLFLAYVLLIFSP